MSGFPKGTRLNGIQTLDDLLGRCRVDEVTGCWHWAFCMDQGTPRVWMVKPDTGKTAVLRGRRAALYLSRGKDIPRGLLAYAIVGCRSADCVNPEHARTLTQKVHGEYLKKTRAHVGLPSKVAASIRNSAARRKVTPEILAEIRSSESSTYALAKRLQLSYTTVKKHRAPKRVEIPGASVFSWGLAA